MDLAGRPERSLKTREGKPSNLKQILANVFVSAPKAWFVPLLCDKYHGNEEIRLFNPAIRE